MFVETEVAPLLDDKLLDASVEDGRVTFAVREPGVEPGRNGRAGPRPADGVTSGEEPIAADRGSGASDEEARRDRQMIEILQELRVAIPGVQILFGFLLTVPFAQRFADVTPTQRTVFYVTLLATAASTACLIAPSAAHRVLFHQSERRFLIESASRLLIAGLAFLAAALTGAVALITDVLFDGAVVWLAPGGVAALIGALWFAIPLTRRETGA